MWLFNVRGSDVSYNPVALSYGLVRAEGATSLYVDPAKVALDVAEHLKVRVWGGGGRWGGGGGLWRSPPAPSCPWAASPGWAEGR